MALPVRMANQAFQTLVISLAAVFLASLILLDLLLLFAVVRPLRRLSTMADQISVGQMDVPELPRGRQRRNRRPGGILQPHAAQPGPRAEDARFLTASLCGPAI